DVDAYASAVLGPSVITGSRVALTRAGRARLARTLRLPEDVRGLNVYAPGGRLVFSTARPDRVGRIRRSPELQAVLRSKHATAGVGDPMGPGRSVVKVWAPLTTPRGRVAGAAEVSLDDSAVTRVTHDASTTIWYAVGIVFGVLWLVLALLVRGASVRMRMQT